MKRTLLVSMVVFALIFERLDLTYKTHQPKVLRCTDIFFSFLKTDDIKALLK